MIVGSVNVRCVTGIVATCVLVALSLCPSPGIAAALSAGAPSTVGGEPDGYQAARVQWIGSSLWGGSALQNLAIPIAIADLKSQGTEASQPAWQRVISALSDYEKKPDADVTPAMNAEIDADTALIDGFLHAAPDASGCSDMGRDARKAMHAWESEPRGRQAGIRVAPLRRAIADLKNGLGSDKGDTGCYPTAIADLQSLKSAPRAQISASQAKNNTIADLDGFKIAYLNAFFLLMNQNFVDVLVR